MKDKRTPGKRSPASNRGARFVILLPALCLLFAGAAIFREFLFGNQVLLYKDIGSDSINDYYPWFVHFSDYIRSEGFPSWSFHVGMGQDIFYLSGYLIWQPVVWLSRGLIPHALVYQHLGKVLLAGLLFFRFLQLRRLKLPASLLGALLLSFSAYMCMGSCWFTLADEVVSFAALLLATESALQNGRWLFLSVAVAFAGLQGAFYLYLSALFLLCYVPARLLGRYGWQPRLILRGCFLLVGPALLGAGLGAVFTIPNLHAILNSPRGSGSSISLVSTLRAFPIFGFESQLHNVTAALRPFSNDLLGTADDFRGWSNYLEAPMTYCGLVCLLMVPQVFAGASRRQKIIYSLFLAGILLTTVFPWFRFLFWFFQGDYYRTLSLFSVLGLIALSMIAFSRYIDGRLNLWLLTGTAVVLVGALFLPLPAFQSAMDPSLRKSVAILLVLYTLLLAIGRLIRWPQILALVIVALAVGELIFLDRITVSRRSNVSKEELKARVGYNDDTIDALQDIRATDNSSFFRLTKTRPSGPSTASSLNDAMVFGYYGTPSYVSFNNINYINFLTAVDQIPPNSETDTRWSLGLLNNALLSLFAGEKYALVDNPLPFQRDLQYEFLKSYEKDFLFRNARFLPLGLGFNQYITREAFLHLTPGEKPVALLYAVILPDKNEADKLGLGEASILDIEAAARNVSLEDIVSARRKSALELTSFSQTRITGNVTLEQRAVLVVQTPFDRGWEAWQDGKPAPVLKVDVGLLGVGLDGGQHKLELRYRTPFLLAGGVVSLISLLLLILGAWRWPRMAMAWPT